MTGTGLNLITKNTVDSYNTAVRSINIHQKENVAKLEKAIQDMQREIPDFYTSYMKMKAAIVSLKRQVYLNQCLIDNWHRSPPYTYPTDLLL